MRVVFWGFVVLFEFFRTCVFWGKTEQCRFLLCSSNTEVSYSFRIQFQGLLNFSPFIPA